MATAISGVNPRYPMPAYPRGWYSLCDSDELVRGEIKTHVHEALENVFDTAHLKYVHGSEDVPRITKTNGDAAGSSEPICGSSPLHRAASQSGHQDHRVPSRQALRSIPFAALHDGTDFIVANYSIAVTPGLSLLAPQLEFHPHLPRPDESR